MTNTSAWNPEYPPAKLMEDEPIRMDVQARCNTEQVGTNGKVHASVSSIATNAALAATAHLLTVLAERDGLQAPRTVDA